jgi:hypothetical protein
LGAHTLFFEERSCRRCPGDFLDLTVVHHDLFDHDSTQLLLARRRRCGDGSRQCQKLRTVGVVSPDAVAVGQLGKHGLYGISFGLVLAVADVAPAVLLSELLQAGLDPCPWRPAPVVPGVSSRCRGSLRAFSMRGTGRPADEMVDMTSRLTRSAGQRRAWRRPNLGQR